MSKISIIIPVYNVADYLEKCLKSVQNQTYQNIQVICVDDGSTDGSGQILDDFVREDPRFVVIHQENRGVSVARNEGLLRADGEYIGFIDADDWIEPNMYERLFYEMQVSGAEIGLASFFWDTEEGSVPRENQLTPPVGCWNRDEMLLYVFKRDYYRGVSAYIWCKLFKRECIERNNKLILFDEEIGFGEDILWVTQVMCHIQKAVWVPECLYHYYQRGASANHAGNLRLMMTILLAYQRMVDYMEDQAIDKEIIGWVKRFHGYWAFKVAETALSQSNEECLSECRRVMHLRHEEYVHYNQEYPKRIVAYEERMEGD